MKRPMKAPTNRERHLARAMGKRLWITLALCALAATANAASITFQGNITQSTPDGTGPAVNNSSLNNIQDLQAFIVTLTFAGSISGPGTYLLTGSSLTFSVPTAPAAESGFAAISLTVAPNATFYDLSLLACLTSGSGCASGNQMTANFRILATLINAQNVAATGLDQPHPLDLLEDDGVTDIQGSINLYSYTGTASPVPEPSSAALLGGALALLGAAHRFKKAVL